MDNTWVFTVFAFAERPCRRGSQEQQHELGSGHE